MDLSLLLENQKMGQPYVDSTVSDPYTWGQLCFSGSRKQEMIRPMATTLAWNTDWATKILDCRTSLLSPRVPAFAVLALK